MTELADYADKYQTIRMERRDGILQVTLHTDGGALQWGLLPHRELPLAFHDISNDHETKVGDPHRHRALSSAGRASPIPAIRCFRPGPRWRWSTGCSPRASRG